MPAATANLIVDQGATFSRSFQWLQSDGTTPVDLTGYTARMQARASHAATVAVVDIDTDAGITITAGTGTIVVALTATETAAIEAGRYFYDLELVSGTTVTRLVQGDFVVTPEVTR